VWGATTVMDLQRQITQQAVSISALTSMVEASMQGQDVRSLVESAITGLGLEVQRSGRSGAPMQS
jgi:hypothetical protein